VPDHKNALRIVLEKISLKPEAVGHRVVHGGAKFSESVLIDRDVIKAIEEFSELAPLHNPPSLMTIKEAMRILKGTLQVAVFDTAFHQTMPDYAYLYAIPYNLYKKYGIRRYGFHGTSHRFVAQEAARHLKRPLEKLNLITCHLGNGCSITAIKSGKVIDTSMGFTPLEGLVMGTRSGDIDPVIISYIIEKEGLNVQEVLELLNKKSGLLGISGISNDVRDIMRKKSMRATLALKVFVYRAKKYISAYIGIIGRIDAIVFTGGIGENQPKLRREICKDLVEPDVRVLVIPTNEELMIARDTYLISTRLMEHKVLHKSLCEFTQH
jgi:acetate kinase